MDFYNNQKHYNPMKYLIPLAALTIGALAQVDFQPMDESKSQFESLPIFFEANLRPEEPVILRDPLIEQPEITQDWAMIDEARDQNPHEPLPPFQPHERKERSEGKHRRKEHHGSERPDHNEMMNPEGRWNNGPRDEFGGPVRMPGEEGLDQKFYNEHESEREDGPKCKFAKKFMHGKGFGHLVFFIILAALSIFLVKKCITKRKNKLRCRQAQIPTNQFMIDEQINKHYAEIERLQQMRNQMQRQVQAEPIIYHQTYPQEMEMTNTSHGRMVNENCYPVNPHQQIPVGRPVLINNPYNQPQVFRANQF